MALISCPECGKEVSDQALACIHCGYPLQSFPPPKRAPRQYSLVFTGLGPHADIPAALHCLSKELGLSQDVYKRQGQIAGPKEIEDGPPEGQPQGRQPRAEEEEQRKGVAQDALGLLVLPLAPVNGAQGRAPHAAQVGKAHEDGNDGQAQPQPGQGPVSYTHLDVYKRQANSRPYRQNAGQNPPGEPVSPWPPPSSCPRGPRR